ncbi:hypothetical protein Terro_0660 [Terriglobus roseus DSM 18391]|uniref:DUF1641 domain-containing protein n=1 Tax=Terriglobus roseus (strain DSM 18391 / NRRL B-41598 / KBS 63) TaxID=926566 RepID=I3ZCM9_TERRK|nr:hypothetical protein [Terriglobus roseus]AFL86997.1 hypothetical protein Terro_0660 [Terriglobus roseus DSM 18391]
MANPIAFTPLPYDPKDGLMRRLEAAPREHAQALLVAYDLLQTAHDEGILYALHGMIHAKDEIVGHLAEAARVQESVNALRNLIAAGKILGSIEPETMSCIAASLAKSGSKAAERPPSFWALFKRATSIEGRRGLAVAVDLLAALGTRR